MINAAVATTRAEMEPLRNKQTSSHSSDSSYGTNITNVEEATGDDTKKDSLMNEQWSSKFYCFKKNDIESNLNDFNIYRFENQRDCEMWVYRRAKAWGTTANTKLWWENFWRNAKLIFTIAGVVLNTSAAITDDENDAKRAMLSIGGSFLFP